MSKLSFKEDPLSDCSENESLEFEKEGRPVSEEVFDNSTSTAVSIDDVTTVSNTKKKRKRKKKCKTVVEDSTAINVSQSSLADSTNHQSTKTIGGTGWLSTFLQKKRSLEICPPPEIMVSDDTYMKLFNSEFTNRPKDNDSDDDSIGSEIGYMGTSAVACGDSNDQSTALLTEQPIDTAAAVIEEPSGPVTAKLTIFNLPYNITVEEVCRRITSLCALLTFVAPSGG